MESPSSIRHYFKAKSVILTGATGFFGQYVLFKLVKFCEVASIFVVLRPKNDECIERRLERLLNGEIFTSVDGKVLKEKIIPLKGDVTHELFGFTETVFERIQECELFIHSAATIRLNATLNESLLNNTNATRNSLQVARRLPKLQKLVHVSTTYVFDKSNLEEKVHEFPLSTAEVNEILNCCLNNNEIDAKLKNKLDTKSSMNNYCLSKTLSELLVAEESKRVETLIFRPSVVCPSIREPYVGWFTGTQVISNTAYFISTGLWRVPNLPPKTRITTIPVDICGNLLLKAISMQTSEEVKADDSQRLTVINAMTHNLLFNWMCKQFSELAISYPVSLSLRPVITEFDSVGGEMMINCKRVLFETSFATLIDLGLKCIGRKPIMKRSVRRMHEFFDSLQECSHLHGASNDNLYDLCGSCSDEDRRLFNFDPRDVDMKQVFVKFYLKFRDQVNGGIGVDESKVKRRQFRVNLIYYLIVYGPLVLMSLLIWSLV